MMQYDVGTMKIETKYMLCQDYDANLSQFRHKLIAQIKTMKVNKRKQKSKK